MEDLLAEFVAETREMLEASAGEIVAWEANPADRARLDTVFRFVHTVKGNCGFFDFPRLEKLSHAAEDALADCRAGRREPDAALVSAVLAIMDRIGAMAEAIEVGEDYPEGGDDVLVAALAGSDEGAISLAASDDKPVDEPLAIGESSHARPVVQRSIRLPVDLLDEVMKGVSDMVLARNDLARRLREAGEQPTITGPFERLSGILADVRTSITRMRMQRLETLYSTLPRLVRDLTNELGKQVMVDFEGGDVELDREMVEMVRDPLTHIIRNAIDHGIETPATRLEAGKREIGLLRFSARQSGNQIRLVITDDGNGIDTEKLGAKAQAAGICSEAEFAAMSDSQKQDLIFEPGLSTADAISNVSGRGVGMDVVRANIEKVGGSIAVSSTPGAGSAFHLQLPLTLSIMAALTVECDGQLYAIPRSYIEEIVFARAESVDLSQVGERKLVTFRGRRVPCIALSDVLGIPCEDGVDWSEKTLVLVRLASDEVFALAVDHVHDHEDVVVKPIAPAIMDTHLYAGTTLLDDGRPMMLLDMPQIASRCMIAGDIRNRGKAADEIDVADTGPGSVSAMMFKGIDGRRRAVRLDLVRRIDTVHPSAFDLEAECAQVVVEGKVLALAGHEGGTLPEERCRLLRLSDGQCEIAYAVAEVIDAIDIAGVIDPVGAERFVEGTALVDGLALQVLDGHALFARYASSTATRATLTCRLPDDSDWARTILDPLVRSAGYRIATGDDEQSDVSIILEDEVAAPSSDTHGVLIKLRANPDTGATDSIYRYDRDGLIAALKNARREGVA